MNKKEIRHTLTLILAVACAGTLSAWLTAASFSKDSSSNANQATAIPAHFITTSNESSAPTGFTEAAEQTINSVVHVKVKIKSEVNYSNNPLFEFFYGIPSQPREQEQVGAGSGVIISPNGYIVTNNHVINGAQSIEVTLNDKRTFTAQVIGSDPSTDLALIKIEADNLQPIVFGNSDNLRIGEWVLAVGNPFNLTSTVTAGIVSAKARNINILNDAMKIESFIQTDAAVNPGNSGGALVNTRGELVGINTAIASQTGSYAGYAFAIPTSIVAKVVSDLREYGVVQRAVLGIQIKDIDDSFAKEQKLSTLSGAYIAEVQKEGSAAKAGLKNGDIITSINNVTINSVSQLQEQVGRYRPGDVIKVGYIRNNKSEEVKVELTNRAGNTDVVKASDLQILGASFAPVSDKVKATFGIQSGLQITKIDRNSKLAQAGIQKGFILLKVNRTVISSEEDLSQVLSKALNSKADEKALFITGVYPNGEIAHYAVDLNN